MEIIRLRSVYVLHHVDDPELKGKIYIGSSQSLQRRLQCHQRSALDPTYPSSKRP